MAAPISREDGRRLSVALGEEDFELAAAVVYRHLLLHHFDCSWCDLAEAFGKCMSSKDVEALLLWGQSIDNGNKPRAKLAEDRYDFTIPPLRPAVRLRRQYCNSPKGMVGAVWCDRIYQYLLSRGCLELVGIEIAEVEKDVPRPLQLTASLSMQTVLDNDYRFDVMPFHKHGLLRETVRDDVAVPACTPGRVPSCKRNSSSHLSTPLLSRPLSYLPPATYSTTTNLGITTKGWTDVGTTIAATEHQVFANAKGRQCQTSQGRVFRPVFSVHVYIREDPVYTLQFRGVTNRVVDTSSSAPPPSPTTFTQADTPTQPQSRRSRGRRSADADIQPPPLATTNYLPGICAAAGAIYRQRLQDSSPVLVYRFHDYIGKNCDADLGAYVALRIGLERCLENGFTPLVLQSDNLLPMAQLCPGAGFVRTLGNYLQEAQFRIVRPMIDELVERNHHHQESLLAATTVKYVNKDNIRLERLPGVSFDPVATVGVRKAVLEESQIGLDKGAMLDRGWVSGLY